MKTGGGLFLGLLLRYRQDHFMVMSSPFHRLARAFAPYLRGGCADCPVVGTSTSLDPVPHRKAGSGRPPKPAPRLRFSRDLT